MPQSAPEILDAALLLTERDRAAIAARLITSLETAPTDPDAETMWDAEIARRIEELDSGEVKCIPWTEARKIILDDGEPRHGA